MADAPITRTRELSRKEAIGLLSIGSLFGVAVCIAGADAMHEASGRLGSVGALAIVSSGVVILFATHWISWIARFFFPAAREAGWGLIAVAIGLGALGILMVSALPIVAAIPLGPFALLMLVAGGRHTVDEAWGGKAARRLTDAATRLGFPVRRKFLRIPVASGDLGGATVRIVAFEDGHPLVEASPRGPASAIHFEAEGARTLSRAVFGEQVWAGDPEFDDRVFVRGDPAEALALLNVETRALLLDVIERGAYVRDGRIRMEWRASRTFAFVPRRPHDPRTVLDGADLERLARRLALVSERLARPTSIPEALLANATQDPLPLVRVANAAKLLAAFPQSPEATEARAQLESDVDPRVRAVLKGPDHAGGELALAEPSAAGAVSLAHPSGAVSMIDGPKKR